ncbi:MAG TPA: hypothetical protein VGC73_02580 [Pyrinomonadaceae bacterium]|jgi:hypothetical protein
MKITTYRSLQTFLMLLLCGNLAFGQSASQPGNKKARSLDDYQPRTLKEIAAMKADAKDLRDKKERLIVTADVLPSMVQVTYTGATRLMPQLKKESIRQWARLYAGSMEHYTEPYQIEMLFLESGKPYWLAVQKNSPLAKRELKGGQGLNLYLIRLGASTVGDKYDWTLLVEDFREADTSQPAAEITFQEMRDGRPPLSYLFFDVVLRNDRSSPRWFLLPSNLGAGHGLIGEKGGVDTLQVFTPRGNGEVIIGRFLGTGGFQALLLRPRAEVRLRRFPISYWGELPGNLQIEIVIADRLTIGGEKAESWFGVKALSSAKADISEDAESVKRLVRSKHSRDNKEVLPHIEEDRRLHLSVSLQSKN